MSFEPLVKACFAATAATDRALQSLKETVAKMPDLAAATDQPDLRDTPKLFTPIPFELPVHSAYRSGEHFGLYQEKTTGHYHWQGLGDYAVLLCDTAYTREREAASDCIFWLHRYSGHSFIDAHTHVYELCLPMLEQPKTAPDFII